MVVIDNSWHSRRIDHVLHGFSGCTGVTPKKGGRLDLSDEQIIAAIEYIVEQIAL